MSDTRLETALTLYLALTRHVKSCPYCKLRFTVHCKNGKELNQRAEDAIGDVSNHEQIMGNVSELVIQYDPYGENGKIKEAMKS